MIMSNSTSSGSLVPTPPRRPNSAPPCLRRSIKSRDAADKILRIAEQIRHYSQIHNDLDLHGDIDDEHLSQLSATVAILRSKFAKELAAFELTASREEGALIEAKISHIFLSI